MEENRKGKIPAASNTAGEVGKPDEVELTSHEVEEHSKRVIERYAAELGTAMLLYDNKLGSRHDTMSENKDMV
jgi:hypothetical protein